ncbi:MAG: hypothetical protein ACREM3_14880 [Candidatus Rokuibacteriota bacterium]
MDQHAELSAPDTAVRARDIRRRLPGQMLDERLETARLYYGPLHTVDEVRARVARTLPHRLGFVRGATLEPIEAYRAHIPDEALLKWDDAVSKNIFSQYWVAIPTYLGRNQADPWIIGQVTGSGLCAVIAQW